MADQPKTGEGDNAKGNTAEGNTEKRTDTQRTLDALKNCFSDQDLIVSETYPFIILFILFYVTTSRAYYLTSEAKRIPCQENIRRGEYDDFISGFVYWIISFCILIFIKFNGINFVNKFVITTDKLNTNLKGDRAKYVGQTLLTGFTSVLNIYFVFILLLTLYHIIDKTVNLIECKSEVCTKYNLCKDGDPSKARYYNSKEDKCFDSNFDDIEKLDDGSNEDGLTFVGEDQLFGTGRGNPNTGRLISDFYPRWLMDLVYVNTRDAGLFFNILFIIVISVTYIITGWNSILLKIEMLVIGLVYLFWWGIYFWKGIDKTGDLSDGQEKDVKEWIEGGGTIGRESNFPPGYDDCENIVCDSPGNNKDISKFGLSSCGNIPSCVELGKTECTGGRCGGGKN